MRQATSPSSGKPYGLARVCRVWGIARSTVSWQRHESARLGARRGPLGSCTDTALVAPIRRVLATPSCLGKGYRCVGIHAAKQGTRFAALEPLRQGVRTACGACGHHIVQGLVLRHAHGSQ
jgi:putative transposase